MEWKDLWVSRWCSKGWRWVVQDRVWGHAGGVEEEVRRLSFLVFLKLNYVSVVSSISSNVMWGLHYRCVSSLLAFLTFISSNQLFIYLSYPILSCPIHSYNEHHPFTIASAQYTTPTHTASPTPTHFNPYSWHPQHIHTHTARAHTHIHTHNWIQTLQGGSSDRIFLLLLSPLLLNQLSLHLQQLALLSFLCIASRRTVSSWVRYIEIVIEDSSTVQYSNSTVQYSALQCSDKVWKTETGKWSHESLPQ